MKRGVAKMSNMCKLRHFKKINHILVDPKN